jgi:hypothetical protein
VLRGGQPLVADPALASGVGTAAGTMVTAWVDGQPRVIAPWIARRVRRMQLREPGLEVDPC